MNENSDHKKSGDKPPQSPPVLVPPDGSEPKQKKPSRNAQLLILALGLLLVMAAAVVLLLPAKQVSAPVLQPEEPQTASPLSPPSTQTSAPIQSNPDEAALEANQLLEQWLQKQAAAEAENIAAWGGDSYAEAVALARECEQELGEKQFTLAHEACAAAIDKLENLLASKEMLLAEALDAGFQALENSDSQAAIGQFQSALAIAADNDQALAGLRRAEKLPEVLQLLDAGQLKEQAGDADAALQDYSEASSLDPDFLPARETLAQLRSVIAEREFNNALSRALQALTKGDLTATAAAVHQARTHKRGDPALRDLQQRLAQAQLARKLDNLRKKGASLESSENWPAALKTCEQALALDSSAAFAANCRQRLRQRIELDGRLQAILSRPERLFADAPLKEARQVIAYASQLSPRGPRLSAQIEQVDQLIRQAEAEVEVVLLSDGLTNVVIYHVGQLGRFQEKRLVLRTGNYTATGSRNGYRDVRQTLKVRPDSGKQRFTLRCEEPI